MRIMVIGSGGREHAIAWKAAQSKRVSHVYVCPGNAGTAMEANLSNIDINADDISGLLEFAKEQNIDLAIVGPEDPLAMGVVDAFLLAGVKCFGPNKMAAQLESSKVFAKNFLKRHKIPTAVYQSFSTVESALDYLQSQHFPIVIKADGLAAGKGVIIANNKAEAEAVVINMLSENIFKEAGHTIIIEEFLQGEEASYICMVQGEHILPMASSQDHKAAYDNDQGPNTGGMGAYSPAPVVDAEVDQKIMRQIIAPTIQGLIKDNIDFTGFLYAGVMIDHDGAPKVLEFNCRLGDPETQAIMMRLQSDIVSHCLAAVEGTLANEQVKWDSRMALGVVMASAGYPNEYIKGHEIFGLNEKKTENLKVFHAGTQLSGDRVVTCGGRVLCVTALAKEVKQAQDKAYQFASNLSWLGAWYRTDIGHRAIDRDK